MGAPSNGSKTAHSKVATSGGHTNTQTSSSKRSSSGADGDYQLVQHEVLYSLSSQYEVSLKSKYIIVLLITATGRNQNKNWSRSSKIKLFSK
jgi:hypothetical protein